MLAEMDDGCVIVDHKFFSQPESELERDALRYSDQITAYKHAVETATSKSVKPCWIHFPNSGP
jgi:hypothetical protein